ncbi:MULTISPECIES: alginate O-acetyltransferase AlgF [unclassified Pigmentiphaga]|uniref:alginate O-acetyltransferase AlgF n=1 Tax=unclassified Pigmentiphaga TaxID=2626614 RepID=UPI000B4108E3|nr:MULTISPECIES: alginate O-acetyltransferase AlgF [unclassified Pigmentiphaga]OVZ62116.1 hypothetical protein CDO46_17720 [Pigmentiphaga sp. NML030171]
MKRALIAALATSLPTLAPHAAGIPLYPTGPAEDSAFVRFVNATDAALEIQAAGSQAKLSLPTDKPSSGFMPVAANKPVKGTLTGADRRSDVAVTVKPGEFATVIALAKNASLVIKESPDDFNAMRASLAFYNADPACRQAGLRAAGRNVGIFDGVGHGQAKRRLINPVAVTVELTCGGKPQGSPRELGALEAGQRYTVLAVPGPQGTRTLFANDALIR